MSAQTVSVVIAAHNAAAYLGATLQSLQAQTHPQWDCIVVDDGSADGTRGVVSAFTADPRIRLISQQQAGVSAARNAGFALTDDSLGTVFLDADDCLLPHALELLVRHLGLRPDAVAAFGYAELMDEQGQPLPLGDHSWKQRCRLVYDGGRLACGDPLQDCTLSGLVLYGPVWPPATCMFRTRSLKQLPSCFAPDLVSQEDWDLTLRLSAAGPLVAVDEQVAWYRRHPSQQTRAASANVLAREVVRCRVLQSVMSPEARHEVEGALRALGRAAIRRLIREIAASLRHGEVRTAVRLSRTLMTAGQFARRPQSACAQPPDLALGELLWRTVDQLRRHAQLRAK